MVIPTVTYDDVLTSGNTSLTRLMITFKCQLSVAVDGVPEKTH